MINMKLTLSSAMDWLLGLNNSDVVWSDPNTSLSFVHQLPGWVWFLIVLVSFGVSGWSYHRLLGNRKARIGLSVVRTLLILLAVALICTPTLQLLDQEEEKDVFIMLVDRSKSMDTPDAVAKTFNENKVISRNDVLKRYLTELNAGDTPLKLSDNREVVWLGFDSDVYKIDPDNLNAPTGNNTLIKTALLKSVNKMAGKYIVGIGLLSDGQSPNEKIDHAVFSKINTPIYTIPVGGDTTQSFLSIAEVDAPDKTYVSDIVPVSIKLDQYPKGAEIDLERVKIKIVNKETGQVIDEKIGIDSIDKKVTLTAQGKDKGIENWKIELSYENTAIEKGQALVTLKDNIEEHKIQYIDSPIRVLYVDGYPRWEYRYLKSVLVREESIDSSILLVSADREFAQEGNTPLQRLPQTADELKDFDVIVVGDIHENYWSEKQKQLLKEHVGKRGAGIIWIGGDSAMPYSYNQAPLNDLLPMLNPADVKRINFQEALRMKPTTLASDLNVLRLRKKDSKNESVDDKFWPSNLPEFWWGQDLGQLKPLATKNILGNFHEGNSSQKYPGVVMMPYGAGKSLYIATDEHWRWRYGLGEHYYQQYWVQLVRMLARYRLQKQNENMLLNVPTRVLAGKASVIELTIDDQNIVSQNLEKIKIGIFLDGGAEDPVAFIELLPKEKSENKEAIIAVSHFQGKWTPDVAGKYTLRVIDDAIPVENLESTTNVINSNDETFAPVDLASMNNIASNSGGKIYKVNELQQMFDALPSPRLINLDKSEEIRQSPLLMFLLILLITVEWVGRKMIKLI